jgi:hypothetical protein
MVRRPRDEVRIHENITKVVCKVEVIRPTAKAVFVDTLASVFNWQIYPAYNNYDDNSRSKK